MIFYYYLFWRGLGFFKGTVSCTYGGFISSKANIIFSSVRDREFSETTGKTFVVG